MPVIVMCEILSDHTDHSDQGGPGAVTNIESHPTHCGGLHHQQQQLVQHQGQEGHQALGSGFTNIGQTPITDKYIIQFKQTNTEVY